MYAECLSARLPLIVAEKVKKESGRVRIHTQTGAEVAGRSRSTVAAASVLNIAPGGSWPYHRTLASADPSKRVLTA